MQYGKIQRRNAIVKMMSLCVIAVFLLTATPSVASAATQTLDISAGSIVITSTGYSQGGAPEAAHAGGYIITGATAVHTVSVASGAHDITLNSVSIELPPATASSTTPATTVCAFSISGSAGVTLTLQGDSKLTSAAGYAGLYVSTGASLRVKGTGSLTAIGGAGRPASGSPYYGGGAGLGGNGHRDSNSFGIIAIESGTVTARGGVTSTNVNYGAGAGLGSGGATAVSPAYASPTGTIVIHGGTIAAYGGECVSVSDTSGGAGIGSGGSNEELNSHITIAIHGGAITARGNHDAAGIGSGSNVHCSGHILIDGGEISAYGGDERDGTTWGGAGIGGGDMGAARSISIGGSAKVTAYGAGAASGIGGGNCGSVWDVDADAVGAITISGSAMVTALGGSSGTTRGGAGIGAGRTVYPASFLCNSGVITVKDTADVTAYAGIGAQAIGVGSGYDYSRATPGEDVLVIDNTVSLQLFNRDATQAAYPPTVEGSGAPLLVAFTLSESSLGGFPGVDTRTAVTKGEGFTWAYSGAAEHYDLAVFHEEGETSFFRSAHMDFGNWAVLLSPPAPPEQLYTLIVENGSGGGQYAAGTRVPITADPPPPGTIFEHWETHNGGVFDDMYNASTVFTMPANDVTITAVYRGINPRTGDNTSAWHIGALLSMLGTLYLLHKKESGIA